MLPKSIKIILMVFFTCRHRSFKGYCPVPKSACAVQRCSTRSVAYLHSAASSMWRLQSNLVTFFSCGAATQSGSWPPHSWHFPRSHTQRRTTVGRTPLDEWSARRRDLYLTTQNTHNRQTSMPPVGFEPTISAGERPQTYALDHAATGTGNLATLATINARASRCGVYVHCVEEN